MPENPKPCPTAVSGDHGRRASALRGLLLLNSLLIIGLGVITFSPNVDAQARVRGDYLMVEGGANGAQGGIVYVVDTTNMELIALTFDPNQKDLLGVGYRNIAQDAASASGQPR